MPLSPGTRLGPYEIVSPLGAGGIGEVYRARDTRLDRTVALKMLPAHLLANPEMGQRLEREARAVSSLNHPHICALYDIGHQIGAHRQRIIQRDLKPGNIMLTRAGAKLLDFGLARSVAADGVIMSVPVKPGATFEASTPVPLFPTGLRPAPFWFYGGMAPSRRPLT